MEVVSSVLIRPKDHTHFICISFTISSRGTTPTRVELRLVLFAEAVLGGNRGAAARFGTELTDDRDAQDHIQRRLNGTDVPASQNLGKTNLMIDMTTPERQLEEQLIQV